MISKLSVKFVWNEPTFKSFEGAVAASKNSDRSKRARLEHPTTAKDTQIIDYRLGASALELLLSDQRILCIACAGDVIDWHIETGRQLADMPRRYASTVQLDVLDHKEVTWNPDALLSRRAGRRGLAILPMLTMVTLAVRGCPELMFSQMVDPSGNRLLFFDDETATVHWT